MFHPIRVSRPVCVLAIVALLASLSVTIGIASGTWVTRAPLSVPRYASAAVEMNGQIHVIGGTTTYACSFLASHDVYNPATETWTAATEAPMSVPRVGFGAVVVNGLLYAVGGNDRCSSELSSVEAYNPATNTWAPRASMSTPRSSLGVGVIGGRIFAVGGLHPSDGGGIAGMLATVEVYDPVTNTWTPQPSLPHGLYNMGIGVIADVLYVAGGAGPSGLTTEVYAFDPATPGAGWVSKAPMPFARHSAGFSSAVVGDRLYVAGRTDSAPLTEVDIYDPATNSWTTGLPLPANLFYPTAVTVNGQLYSLGGISGSNVPLAGTLVLVVVPPVTTASLSPVANGNGWNNGNVFVTLNATASGTATVTSITYTLSGAQVGSATVAGSSASLTVSVEGTTTVTYHAVDSLGNVETNQVATVRIDRTPPVITPILDQTILADSPAGGTFVFTPTATDIGGSGVVSVTASHPGPQFPTGETTVTLNAMDAAGNGALPVTFTVSAEPALVSLSITPSEAAILSGQTQQFIGIGQFSDGSTQTTEGDGGGGDSGGGSGGPGGGPGGGTPPVSPRLWAIEFPAGLNQAPCGVTNSGGLFTQAFNSDATTGAVDVVWSPSTPTIRAVGTLIPESEFNATLTCTNGNAATGSISATWSGPNATRFLGTYSFGGTTGNVVIKGWSPKPSIPHARFALGAAAAGGKVYAMGGVGENQMFDLNEVYDPATNSWSTAAPMPMAREGMGVGALGGRIYVAGGNAGGSVHSRVDVFDPVTGSWDSAPADLLHARAHFALVSTGTALYAIGGETGPSFSGVMASVERYDPGPNTWTEVAPLPEPRAFLAGGAVNGGTLIIVAGGGGAGGAPSPTPYVYDLPAGTWRTGPEMMFTIGVAGGAVIDNGFYVWTGGPCAQAGQVFVPEIVTAMGTRPEGWSYLAPMRVTRGQFGIAAIGDVVYLAGGQTADGAIDALESYSTIPWHHFATQLPGSGASLCGGAGGGGGGSGSGGSGDGGGSDGGDGDDGPTWRVLDATIASIDQRGLATGLSPGVTTVVIEYGGVSCLAASTCATLTVDIDTDGDGTGNNADADDDGDGVLDSSDVFPLDATESVDTDGDGTGNTADLDDDGDGVADVADAFPLNAAESVDTDGDGTGNNADPDDDGDGVLDSSDVFPLDATESVDTDGDGTGNNADADDDNDAFADAVDGCPLTPGSVNGCTPVEALDGLEAQVASLPLAAGAKRALSATLAAADAAIARENPRVAQLLMRAFILEVRSLQRRGLLAGPVADALAADAQAIANGV